MGKALKIQNDKSNFENDDQLNRLKTLINDARTIGCVAALRKHNHNIEYLTDDKRSRYIDLLNIQSVDDVLEIGASMGQHTRLIAEKCRTLEAIEVVEGQAEFASLWCEQSGLSNVNFTAGGSSGALPYESNSFSVVIMNYVLEWCAGRDATNPDEFHLNILKEVHRVMKPGGSFFLSTKNRFGLRLLLGEVDEHLGIHFGNALPRPLGKELSSRLKRDIPKGYLHSSKGLRKMLERAGFSSARAFLSFPDARWPDMIVPFTQQGVAELRKIDRAGYSKKERLFLVLPGFLMQRIATSHMFIATK